MDTCIEINKITPEFFELYKLGILSYKDGYYLCDNKYTWIVNISLGIPIAQCPTCRQVTKGSYQWNQLLKFVRKEHSLGKNIDINI